MYVVKYEVRKMAKTSLLTSNIVNADHQTAVCLQTMAIFHLFYGFEFVFWVSFLIILYKKL